MFQMIFHFIIFALFKDQKNKIHKKLVDSFKEIKNKFTSVADIISAKEKILVEHSKNSVLRPHSDSSYKLQKRDLTVEEQQQYKKISTLNFNKKHELLKKKTNFFLF